MLPLSVVTTLYKSAPYLEAFVQETAESVNRLGIKNYEIIMVDDGSPDNSAEVAEGLQARFPEIAIARLSRNFGHHHAAFAGLTLAQGELVFLIDSDLEIAPSFLENLKAEMDKTRADVVYGFQELRKGGFTERIGGQMFWWMIRRFSQVEIPANITTERLMNRKYVDALISMNDATIFMAGMMYWVGFKQVGIVAKKKNRKGTTTYSFKKRLQLAWNAITTFTAYPLQIVFNLGLLLTIASFLYGLLLLGRKLIYPDYVLKGYTSILVILLFSTGFIVLSIGLVGLYVAKLFDQTKNRPRFIIKEIIKHER